MYSVLDNEIYSLDPNVFYIWYLSYFHLKEFGNVAIVFFYIFL